MNEEIQIKPVDASIREKPGHKFESMFTADDRSCSVRVFFVDLETIVSKLEPNFNSKSDKLIKFSEARFSPVSSESAEHIQIAVPFYYREFEAGVNSEFIADDRESSYIESLSWRNRGSIGMETMKEKLTDSLFGIRNNLNVKMTWARDDFWMYCTSIDPNNSYEREKQMKFLSSSYDFMTKIEEPSEFAKQFGRDVGKQFEFDRDLKCDNFVWHTLALFGRKQREFLGDYLVDVNHGPVIYLDDIQIETLFNNYSEEHRGSLIPFVKRKMYKEQKEYRFVVSVRFHNPNKDTFCLRVTDRLRNLMAPIEDLT